MKDMPGGRERDQVLGILPGAGWGAVESPKKIGSHRNPKTRLMKSEIQIP